MKLSASVIGGINLDITGYSKNALIGRDSNPGSIRFSPGGVGRNIAQQLAQAGLDVTLFTAISKDSQGEMLKNSCAETGICVDFAKRSPLPTSCYLSIHDSNGDMALAINDMALIEEITPDYLKSVLDRILKANICVIDANLSPESLTFLAENVTLPIIADPVSCVKAARLTPILHRLSAFKPNLIEAMELTGAQNEYDAAKRLLALGVKRTVISMGEKGVFYMDSEAHGMIAPEKVFTCQTNGAGDAMCAGIAVGAALNESARDCARRGLLFSARLLQSRE